MSDKDLQRYRHYESMIKKARKTGIGEKPPSCAKCQYYQPDFKYRKCLYARCPYQRDTEIFRKRPLKKDKIPGYLDYFYGLEADAYSFIRVPKLLINLPIYKDLTSDDKLLYGILLDRMSLSAKNRWMDDDGRVYIIFTIEDVMEALNCAQHKAVKLMNNLETKAHLIERKRQGQGKPSLIYVKKFVPMSNAQFLNCQNRNSGIAESTIQELPKPQCNNTESNNTEYSDTDLFFSQIRRDENESLL